MKINLCSSPAAGRVVSAEVLSCRGVLAMLAFCAITANGGTTYYLKTGETDFTNPSNYTVGSIGGETASSLPGADDQIVLPDNITFAIAGGSTSFNVLSGVKRICPQENSVLEFTIADGSTNTLNAAVNWDADSKMWNVESGADMIHHWGKIVKKGGGTLILAASGTLKSGITANQDYFTAIDLKQGTLKFPQHAVGAMYFGDLTMAEGTTLVTCGNVTNSSLGTATYLRSINGSGIVTNESGRTAGQMCSPYARDVVACSEFHGRFCHPVRHWLDGRFVQYGHETGITQPLTVQYNYGHLNDGYDRGVYSFEDVALLGSHENIQFYRSGGGIHYFGGEDAVMSKNVNLYCDVYPGFVDAGWHGGLRCTGKWNVSGSDQKTTVQKWLVLTGSNAVPCTVEGDFVESKFSGDFASPVPYTIVVQKLGSGTWRFKGDRTHGGGFVIEEGSLQFDSIAERGVASSLGFSTNLTEMVSVRNPTPVDYAFALGSTKNSAPAAVFEFTGSTSCQSSTRPLVLKGKGGSIRASGTAGVRLGFGGVSALAAGETTLTLDGTNTNNNVASGIVDGNGKVNVVKDGEGDWYLSGTNTFSGDLHVKAGTLTVLGGKYSWFRFTVKELGSYANVVYFRQLALYDANGVRQNICLNVNPPASAWGSYPTGTYPDGNWQVLEPGSFAFGMNFRANNYAAGEYVDQLFSDIGNTASSGIQRADGEISYGKTFKLGIVTSADFKPIYISKSTGVQLPFVMRLTNGAPEIVSYDIESYWNTNQTNNWPKIATMEASVDGIHWDLVETNSTGAVVAEHEYDFSIPLGGPNGDNSNKWYSDGTSQVNWDPTTGTTPRPGKGFPIRGHVDIPTPLQNVRSVSVAAGATLKTDAGVEIRSLKVDAADAGTIDGFTFAENGTIDVTNPPENSSFLPGAYSNCSGLENIGGWALNVNGAPNAKCKVSVRNGKLYFARPGFVLTYR